MSVLLRECRGLGFTKKLEAKPRSLHDNYQDDFEDFSLQPTVVSTVVVQ